MDGANQGIAALIAFLTGLFFFIGGPVIGIIAGVKMTIKNGGAFGAIASSLEGARANVEKGRQKRRQELRAGSVAEMKAGNRFSNRNPFTRGFNNVTGAVGTGWKGRYGLGARGQEAKDQARRTASAELKKTAAFQAIANNDDATMAATYNSESEARSALTQRFMEKDGLSKADASARANSAVKAVQASVGFGRSQAIAAAEQLVSTGTGYTDLKDMATTLARASGGHSGTATSLAGFANAETKKVGRNDLAPGFGGLNDLVQHSVKTGGAADDAKYVQAGVAAAMGTDNATLVRNKTPGVVNHAKALRAGLAAAQAAGDTATATRISYKLQNIEASGMYGPEHNMLQVHDYATGASQTASGNRLPSQHEITIQHATTTRADQERLVDPDDKSKSIPNPEYDPAMERAAAIRQRQRYDPNDIRNNAP